MAGWVSGVMTRRAQLPNCAKLTAHFRWPTEPTSLAKIHEVATNHSCFASEKKTMISWVCLYI